MLTCPLTGCKTPNLAWHDAALHSLRFLGGPRVSSGDVALVRIGAGGLSLPTIGEGGTADAVPRPGSYCIVSAFGMNSHCPSSSSIIAIRHHGSVLADMVGSNPNPVSRPDHKLPCLLRSRPPSPTFWKFLWCGGIRALCCSI